MSFWRPCLGVGWDLFVVSLVSLSACAGSGAPIAYEACNLPTAIRLRVIDDELLDLHRNGFRACV